MSKSDLSRRAFVASPSAASARRHEAAKPQRRTQAERSAQMQRRILEAASEVIRKRGYARFRTAEVARVAGVSRGAQLHHFPTKKTLVVATLRHVFEQALQVEVPELATAAGRPPPDLPPRGRFQCAAH